MDNDFDEIDDDWGVCISDINKFKQGAFYDVELGIVINK